MKMVKAMGDRSQICSAVVRYIAWFANIPQRVLNNPKFTTSPAHAYSHIPASVNFPDFPLVTPGKIVYGLVVCSDIAMAVGVARDGHLGF